MIDGTQGAHGTTLERGVVRGDEGAISMMVISVQTPEMCDRCGHQAYWQYENAASDASPLCFCGHHSYVLMSALREAGFIPSMLVVRGVREPVAAPAG